MPAQGNVVTPAVGPNSLNKSGGTTSYFPSAAPALPVLAAVTPVECSLRPGQPCVKRALNCRLACVCACIRGVCVS
jgi:hypothetical protein